jgi:hypothetical protein
MQDFEKKAVKANFLIFLLPLSLRMFKDWKGKEKKWLFMEKEFLFQKMIGFPFDIGKGGNRGIGRNHLEEEA